MGLWLEDFRMKQGWRGLRILDSRRNASGSGKRSIRLEFSDCPSTNGRILYDDSGLNLLLAILPAGSNAKGWFKCRRVPGLLLVSIGPCFGQVHGRCCMWRFNISFEYIMELNSEAIQRPTF